MLIAAWNVNSITVRLPRLVAWLETTRPDVLCVQETKIDDARFPTADIAAAGYAAHVFGQKTYNGVALLVRQGLAVDDVSVGIPGYADEQRRVIAATVAGIRVVGVYVPNGQAVGSDKYAYKLDWLAAFATMLRDERARHPELAVGGDFNVAPDDRDVHDPAAWEGQVLVSAPERAAFRALLETGLVDSFRLFDQPPATYSWWDYRMLAFAKNRGMRIDHILLSPPLAQRCLASRIDRNARKGAKPSDHAPVVVELRTDAVAS
ncbi:MAG: exodeoxyribonuclease III [Burkholderiales bacterium]|nr:exodeoxyribonuclease III [Burkholderiales bacterium]